MNLLPILSATTIKQICPDINNTINNTLIDQACILQQQTLLKDTLGQMWFDDLYGQFTGGTYSTPNAYILENYLQYILAFGVWKHLMISLSFQLNDAGLRTKISDHSSLAENKDMYFYREYIDSFINNKRKEMFRYITYHQSDYPLYYSTKYWDHPQRNINDWKIRKV